MNHRSPSDHIFCPLLASRLSGRCWSSDLAVLLWAGFSDRIEHDAARQQFRQNMGFASAVSGDDYIGRNAAASDTADFAGDFGIIAHPVGVEKDVVSTKEFLLNTSLLQDRLHIDLA